MTETGGVDVDATGLGVSDGDGCCRRLFDGMRVWHESVEDLLPRLGAPLRQDVPPLTLHQPEHRDILEAASSASHSEVERRNRRRSAELL